MTPCALHLPLSPSIHPPCLSAHPADLLGFSQTGPKGDRLETWLVVTLRKGVIVS